MREVPIGQVDYTVFVKITGTDGAPETALAHTDIDIAYARVETDNDVTTADVSPADLANLTAAHSDWGWEEVSATDHPGLYRLDIADAVFASGAWEAVVTITDASGADFYPVDIGFRLVAFNAQDGVRMGLTALPNAAADAPGGLPISDAGGLDLDAQLVTKINDILTDTGTTLQAEVDAIQAKTDNLPSDPADASVVAGLIAAVETKVDTVDTVVDAIKAKTDNLPSDPADQSLVIAATDALATLIGDVPTNAELATALGAADDAILARLPAALTADGNMKCDVLRLNGDATAAANIAKTTRAIGRGAVTTGATTTSIPTSAFTPAGVDADQFKGRICTFDADTATTALRGQSTDITANTDDAAPVFTVTALTTAPASGDTFSVT